MSVTNKQWFGLPLHLLWGYIAIAVFMTGDGFELAFCPTTSKSWDSLLHRLLLPSRFMG